MRAQQRLVFCTSLWGLRAGSGDFPVWCPVAAGTPPRVCNFKKRPQSSRCQRLWWCTAKITELPHNRSATPLLLRFTSTALLIPMHSGAFCVLHVAVLPLAVLLQHTLCCCRQVLLAPPHPAAVWACVARFEVLGVLIPVAHQQQAREECCSSLDFDKATGGCWSLPPPALIAAMI